MTNGDSPGGGGSTGAGEPWRAEMRRIYADTLAAKLATLEGLVAALAAAPDAPAERARLYDAVHKIRGSAGAYGFGPLSDVAAEWEQALAEGADVARVRELFARLAAVTRAALAGDQEDRGPLG